MMPSPPPWTTGSRLMPRSARAWAAATRSITGPKIRWRPSRPAERGAAPEASRPTESLRRHVQRAVELARHVLEGDQTGQLDERVVAEPLLQPLHQLIGHPALRASHGFRIIESGALALIED